MAFDRQYLGKAATTANTKAPNMWTYNASATGSNDALAVVIADNYFDGAQVSVATATAPIQVGDAIYIRANNGNRIVGVAAITPHVTTAALA